MGRYSRIKNMWNKKHMTKKKRKEKRKRNKRKRKRKQKSRKTTSYHKEQDQKFAI
jgi:hypothetical protein